MERWNRMPEWARWTLLFPALLLGSIAIGLESYLFFGVVDFLNPAPGWAWTRFLWHRVLEPFFITNLIITGNYAMLLELTPARGRRVLGWVFCILMTTLAVLGTLLLLGSRLGAWGLLSAPQWIAVWEEKDWGELAGGVAWLTIGIFAFHEYLGRVPATRPKMARQVEVKEDNIGGGNRGSEQLASSTDTNELLATCDDRCTGICFADGYSHNGRHQRVRAPPNTSSLGIRPCHRWCCNKTGPVHQGASGRSGEG